MKKMITSCLNKQSGSLIRAVKTALLLLLPMVAFESNAQSLPMTVGESEFNNGAIFTYKLRVGCSGSEIKTDDFQDGGEAIFHFTDEPASISLQYSRSKYGKNRNMKVQESADGQTWSDLYNGDPSNSWQDLNKGLKRDTRYIRLYYDAKYTFGDFGSRVGYWRNINVTKALVLKGDQPAETHRYASVSGTVYVKTDSRVTGNVELSTSSEKLVLGKKSVTADEAHAGIMVPYTYTPTADGTEVVSVLAAEATGYSETAEITFNVVTPPATYGASVEGLTFIKTADGAEIPAQTLFLTAEYVQDAVATVSINGDFKLSVDGGETYVSSVDLVPVAGIINKELLVMYEASAGVNQATLRFGSVEIPVILKQPATIAFTETIAAKTYGDEAFDVPAYTSDNEAGVVTYSVKNAAIAEVRDGKIVLLSAGKTEVILTQAESTLFGETSISTPLEVSKAMLQVSVADTSRNYGEANPNFVLLYTGFANEDSESMLDTAPVAVCEAAADDIDDFEITISGGEDHRYDFAYTSGNLSIVTPEAEMNTSADYLAYAYDEDFEEYNDKAEIMLSTKYLRDEAVVKVNNGYLIREKGKKEYVESLSFMPIKGVASAVLEVLRPVESNNEWRGQLSFGAKTVELGIILNTEITMNGTLEQVYGDVVDLTDVTNNKEVAFVYEVGDDQIVSAEGVELRVIGVGSTTVKITQPAGMFTSEASKTVTLNAEKALLKITAKDTVRMVGTANPEFELLYSGFVNGEDEAALDVAPSVSCEADASSEEGRYPIVITVGEDSHYAIDAINGTLRVTHLSGLTPSQISGDLNIYVVDNILMVRSVYNVTSVAVSNLQGALIKRVQNPESGLDLSDLIKGIYIVSVETEAGKESIKISIK